MSPRLSSVPGSLQEQTQQSLRAEWDQFDGRAALRCSLAVVAPIVVGVATGHARTSVLIAAGAFSVGFGSFQKLRNSQLLPMLLATVGMCLSSWAGTLAGSSSVLSVIVCGAAALAYAASFRAGRAASWIALQCTIWLVISTAYPERGVQALTRGSLILAGGLLQTAVMIPLLRWGGAKSHAMQEPAKSGAISHEQWRSFSQRAFLTIVIATALYRWVSAQYGYWIPMTATIVLRPDLEETLQRGVARGVGTIIGIIIAAVIVAATGHAAWVLAIGICLCVWGSYALFRVGYGYFAACLTAYVVFLLSLAGIREQPLLLHRLEFTLLGVALALALRRVGVWATEVEGVTTAQYEGEEEKGRVA